jgi:hypothetical protein
LKYRGDYKDGSYNGEGTLDDNGNIWIGEFINGKKNGQFIYMFASGNLFKGNYVDDKRCGKGEVRRVDDNSLFEGTYSNDRLNGFAVHSFPDGSRYEGEFKMGEKNGPGV